MNKKGVGEETQWHRIVQSLRKERVEESRIDNRKSMGRMGVYHFFET